MNYWANDIYDADQRLSTANPAYTYALGQIYYYFRVLGLKYSITVINNGAKSLDCHIIPSFNDTLAVASQFESKEFPYSQRCVLGFAGASNAQHTFTGYLNFAEIYGDNDLYKGNYDTVGAMPTTQTAGVDTGGNSPTEPCGLYVYVKTTDGSNVASYGAVVISRFEFYTELFQPNIKVATAS